MAKGIPRQGGSLRRFFAEATPYDLIVATFAVAIGILGAVKYFRTPGEELIGWFLSVAVALVGITTITKLIVLWCVKEASRKPHDLKATLHALHALLLPISSGPDSKLRLTLHVPFKNGEQLEQALEYVGDGRAGKTAGRCFSTKCGIIGRAFRMKQTFVAKRQNADPLAYHTELVNEWGYSAEEARKRDSATSSWMAVPLLNELDGNVYGVVYLDSVDAAFFDDNRQSLVVTACTGIARYVTERYN